MGKKKPNVKGKVCRHHPSTPAVTRCTTCFKPICRSCLVIFQSEDFCSRQCAEQYRKSSESIAAHGKKERGARAGRKLKKVVLTVLVLALLGYGGWFWYAHPDTVKSWLGKAKSGVDSVQEKVDGGIDNAKSKGMGETGGQ